MTDIPKSLSEVTSVWLEKQFRDAGHEIPELLSFTHKPMDGFTGAMGEVGIFTIEWSDSTKTDLPDSFVAK